LGRIVLDGVERKPKNRKEDESERADWIEKIGSREVFKKTMWTRLVGRRTASLVKARVSTNAC
jgi:hypothetical protein